MNGLFHTRQTRETDRVMYINIILSVIEIIKSMQENQEYFLRNLVSKFSSSQDYFRNEGGGGGCMAVTFALYHQLFVLPK